MRFDHTQLGTQGFLLPPATINADNTPASFDIGAADSCSIFLAIGVGGITFDTTNKVEFVLSHSDVTGSGFTPVTQDHVAGVTVTGSGIVRSLVAAHAAATVTAIGYTGGKRFLRLLADFSGTHGTGTPMTAVAVRNRLDRIAPV
jgi:hypothetical protein